MRMDVKGIHYKAVNEKIRESADKGNENIVLDNVNGHRYIGAGLSSKIKIKINGVPGNDLGAFMDGPTIIVSSNGQDGIGNTMNAGKIIIHGSCGDIAGHAMRGGSLYVKGDAGYRIGIHMKSYKSLYPVIIIGGTVGDFLGEYMAGGLIIVLGLDKKKEETILGNYCGTGMHGGTIYIRGDIKDYQLGKEVKNSDIEEEDKKILKKYLKEYCKYFSLDADKIMNDDFKKLIPSSKRPYGKLYAY